MDNFSANAVGTAQKSGDTCYIAVFKAFAQSCRADRPAGHFQGFHLAHFKAILAAQGGKRREISARATSKGKIMADNQNRHIEGQEVFFHKHGRLQGSHVLVKRQFQDVVKFQARKKDAAFLFFGERPVRQIWPDYLPRMWPECYKNRGQGPLSGKFFGLFEKMAVPQMYAIEISNSHYARDTGGIG